MERKKRRERSNRWLSTWFGEYEYEVQVQVEMKVKVKVEVAKDTGGKKGG